MGGVETGIQIPLQIHKFPYYSYSRGQARRRSQEHDRRRSQKLLQARRPKENIKLTEPKPVEPNLPPRYLVSGVSINVKTPEKVQSENSPQFLGRIHHKGHRRKSLENYSVSRVNALRNNHMSSFNFKDGTQKNLIKCSLLNAIESGNIITDGKPPKYHQRPENRRAKSEMSHTKMIQRAEPTQNHIGLTKNRSFTRLKDTPYYQQKICNHNVHNYTSYMDNDQNQIMTNQMS